MARVEAVFTLRDDMSRKLKSLAGTAKGTEKALNSLRKEVNHLIRRLDALDKKNVTVSVKVRGFTRAEAQITELHRKTKSLDGTTATVRVRTVETGSGTTNRAMRGGAEDAIIRGGSDDIKIPGTNISSRGAARTVRYFQLRSKIIMGLIVTAIGALGPLFTALQSLGVLVTAVGAGFVGLGAAAGTAFAFGYKFFSEYTKKTRAQMNDAELALSDSLERLKKKFSEVVSEKETKRFGFLMANMVDMGTKILPMLDGTMEKFLTTFESLQKRFERSFFAPKNAALFQNVLRPLPRQFEALAAATGHFARILGGLIVAAAPVTTRLFEDLERYLGKKADYRTSTNGLNGTRSFFVYMYPILKRVTESMGNIYDNLALIGRAGRKSVGPILDAFDELVDALGLVLAVGADKFGEPVAKLLTDLAIVVRRVGPTVIEWMGRFADAASFLFEKARQLPGPLKSLASGFLAFFVLKRVIPGLGTFTRLIGKLFTYFVGGKLIAKMGGLGKILGGFKLPGGAGRTVGDSLAGIQMVRITPGQQPIPVFIVNNPGVGGAVGRGGKGAAKGGRLGGILRGAGRFAGFAGLGSLGAGAMTVGSTVLLGGTVATLLSGQGPFSKQLTPQAARAARIMGGAAGSKRGAGIVESVIGNNPATKNSAAGLRTQVMSEILKLPPEMQTAAAKGAQEFIAGLESKNIVARQSTQVFLEGARSEIANFKTEIAQMMEDLRVGMNPPAFGGMAGAPASNARGGIVTGFTLSTLGERGPEAVIPLTNRARRDQILREAGVGGGSARGQRASSPLVQIGSVTVNNGDDMNTFVFKLENAVKRAVANVPRVDAGAMLA